MDIFYSIQVNIRQVVTSDLLFISFAGKVMNHFKNKIDFFESNILVVPPFP